MLHQDIFTVILAAQSPNDLLKSRQLSPELNKLATIELFTRRDRKSQVYQSNLLLQWRHSHKAVIPSAALLASLQHLHSYHSDQDSDQDHVMGLQTIASWEGMQFEIEDDVVHKEIAKLKKVQPTFPGYTILTLGAFFPYVKSLTVRKQILEAIIGFRVGRSNAGNENHLTEAMQAYENIYPYLALPDERKQLLDAVISILVSDLLGVRTEYIPIVSRMFTHSRSAEERNQLWDALEEWMHSAYHRKTLVYAFSHMYLDMSAEERTQRLNALIEIAKGNISQDAPYFLRNIFTQLGRPSIGLKNKTGLIDDEHSELRQALCQFVADKHRIKNPEQDEQILNEEIARAKQIIQIIAAHLLQRIYRDLTSADDRKIVLSVIIGMFDIEDINVRRATLKIVKKLFSVVESADERKQIWSAFTKGLSEEHLRGLLKDDFCEEYIWPDALMAVIVMYPYLPLPDADGRQSAEREQALSIVLERKDATESVEIIWKFIKSLEQIFLYLTLPGERKQVIDALIVEKAKHKMYAWKALESLAIIYQYVTAAEQLEEDKPIWDEVREKIKQSQVVASLDDLLGLIEKGMSRETRRVVLPDLESRLPHLTAADRERVLSTILRIHGEATSGVAKCDALKVLGSLLLCKDVKVSPALLALFHDDKEILSRLIVAGRCTAADLEAMNITQHAYGTLLLHQARWVAQIQRKLHEKYAVSSPMLLFSQTPVVRESDTAEVKVNGSPLLY